MALTNYEYRYRITGSDFILPITCNSTNSVDNLDGTITIIDIPDEDIATGDFQVRVKSIGINPPSDWLVSDADYTFTSPLDTTILRPDEVSTLLFDGDFSSELNTIINGKVATLKNLNGTIGDLSQPTDVNRPDYFASGGLNNLPYARFNANKVLSSISVNVDLPYTMYIVVKQNSFLDGGIVVDFGEGFTTGVVQKTILGVQSLSIVNNGTWVPKDSKYYSNDYMCYGLEISPETFGAWVQKGKQPKTLGLNSGQYTKMSRLSIGSTGSNFSEFDIQYLCLFEGSLTPLQNLRLTNFFKDKFNLPPDEYLLSFGDSITMGANSTDYYSNSYVGLLSQYLNVGYCNRGITSTAVSGSSNPDNLINIYQDLDFVKTNTGYLTFSYGTNDTPSATWENDYKNIIQYFIDKGFDKSKIAIVTPPYQSVQELKLEEVLTRTANIASELNIIFVDCFTFMKNNGGDTLLSDGKHPNDAGHQIMAQLIYESFTI